jgi:type I restriction-modification system DNA methylase subunit
MDVAYAKNLIRNTFEHPFDKTLFADFTHNLLKSYEPKTFSYQSIQIQVAYQEFIQSYERLGKYFDSEGKEIDILIVNLKKGHSLDRARSMQRNFVSRYLNGGRDPSQLRDAALVAFVAPDSSDWRFSLVKMDYQLEETLTGKVKVKTDLTPARRWSFRVGEFESSHTAQSRFMDILKDDDHPPELSDLEKAFNVEVVTREFFEKYRGLFVDVKEAVDHVIDNDQAVGGDFAAKNINTSDFAKKLLGQIVFLYFLQKKGWFGVARDQDWGSGPRNFLRRLFEKKHANYNNFFNDILEPLFYEALAKERDGDFYSRFNCKIPFLNGGLFDPLNAYEWVHIDILLPDKLFSNNLKTKEGDTGSGILDVFDLYNFTVKEDEPLEKEVAVDPEMLGKVFENLLEVKDRKSKGTYYTPREIVHYMCQESLINYLDTAVNAGELAMGKEKPMNLKLFGAPATQQMALKTQGTTGRISHEDIEEFIRKGELTVEHDTRGQEILNQGKRSEVYVPRLASAIRENAALFDAKLAGVRVCDPAVGSGAFLVGMMNELVRARSTLNISLAQSGRTRYDFKRHAIQECLYGVDIDPGAVEIAKLRLWLSLVVDEDDYQEIKPLPNLDYKIVCGNSLLGVERNIFNNILFEDLEKLIPLHFDETSAKKKQEFKKHIDQLIKQLTNENKTFDFEVYFSGVFHQKGGFDVVIANPPYVFTRGSDFTDSFKKMVSKYYSCGTGKINLFSLFIERASQILTGNGVYAYIIPNTFFRATSYKSARELIANNQKVLSIVDLHAGIFEFVTASTSVIVIQKNPLSNKSIEIVGGLYEYGVPSTRSFLDQKLFKNQDCIFCIYVNDKSQNIFQKMTLHSIRLQNLCLEIIEGIVTPKGKDDYISQTPINTKYKPFLEGKDIGRYKISWKNKYILFDRDVLHRARPDYVWASKEKILIRRIGGGSRALHAALDTQQFFTFASINNLILKSDSQVPYKYLLALLNSKLLNWFYIEKFTNRSELTVNISRTYLDQLPVVIPPKIIEDQIISLVNQILSGMSNSNEENLPDLERQIDLLVYQLYGLTSEERDIVEGTLPNDIE